MATQPVITGVPTRAPGIARRSLLASLAMAPALAVVPALAKPARGIRPSFLAAEQRFRTLEKRSNRYDALVAMPARRRQQEAEDALPHTTVSIDMVAPLTLTTERDADLKVARYFADKAKRSHRSEADVIAARRLLAAHHRRRRAIERLPQRRAAILAAARHDEISGAAIAAEDAFYEMPVVSLAELAHKLTVMSERQVDYEGCAERILPDVRALMDQPAGRA